MKNLCKSERSFKDMSVAAEEDCKNHEKMQALIDQTEGKVKAHRCWMSRVLDVWVLAGFPGSRSRRPRRLLPSIWPSTARWLELLLMLWSVLVQKENKFLFS